MKKGSFKSVLTLIFALGFVALSGVSCVKKGEEDPIISLRSRTNRLTGNWDVQSISVSSQVSLNEYWVPGVSEICQKEFVNHFVQHDMLFDFDADGTVQVLQKSSDHTFLLDSCVYQDTEINIDQSEKWSFNSDETAITISTDNGVGNSNITYEIYGLSNNEMKLTYNVILNFIMDADGAILHYDAPQVYTATMILEKT